MVGFFIFHKGGKMEIEGIKIKSQRLLPSQESLEEIKEIVEEIKDEQLKRCLTLICCSGFRIGEAINSYLYIDSGKIYVRGILEKKTNFTGIAFCEIRRGFLGREFLLNNLTNPKFWKSVPLMNVFDLDISCLVDYINSDIFHVEKFVLENTTYKTLYKKLKKETKEFTRKVYVRLGKYEEKAVVSFVKPSFHFYRKAFVVKASKVMQNPFDVINYIKWDNVNQILHYYNATYQQV